MRSFGVLFGVAEHSCSCAGRGGIRYSHFFPSSERATEASLLPREETRRGTAVTPTSYQRERVLLENERGHCHCIQLACVGCYCTSVQDYAFTAAVSLSVFYLDPAERGEEGNKERERDSRFFFSSSGTLSRGVGSEAKTTIGIKSPWGYGQSRSHPRKERRSSEAANCGCIISTSVKVKTKLVSYINGCKRRQFAIILIGRPAVSV